jgi:MinD-like ATPase involved in chromosome partitioning or flagellar assembly
MGGPRGLSRSDLFRDPVLDGRDVHDRALRRFKRRMDALRVTRPEREELELEGRLRAHPGVTRANVIAVVSPKGGVGKTTATFLAGNVLASHLKLRTVAVDASPDFGTLGHLPRADARPGTSLAELLEDADHVATAAELGRYVARLPSGLHLLASRNGGRRNAASVPSGHGGAPGSGAQDGRYGELLALLSCFYEAILLDLGTGVAGPLNRLAVDRADQIVVLTTQEWITASAVLDALAHLDRERTTAVVNMADAGNAAELRGVETALRNSGVRRAVTIPRDGRLGLMLATGTYSLEALDRRTRVPVKRLGVAVAERLA